MTAENALELVEQPAPNPGPVALQTQPAPTQSMALMRMIETAVMRPDFDVAKMQALLQMKREFDAEEARKAFIDGMAGFRGENIVIPKSKHVDRGKAGSFMQAEFDQVCMRLSPALSRHGFGFRHDQKFGLKAIEGAEGAMPWVWVTCFLEHRGGHSERLDLEGPPGELSANTPVQNMQATASFLKRQSLLAITGTATGGEDDENGLRAARGRQDSGPADAESDDLLQRGHAAAMEGMKPLTAWWGSLTAKQRGQWAAEFGRMRKAAALADGAAQ